MPFIAAMPNRATKPMAAEMLNGMSARNRPSMPPTSASGMALLSAFPEEEIRRVVASHTARLAAHGEPDAVALVARLLKAKKLGYADLTEYNSDPDFNNIPTAMLTSKPLPRR